VTVVPGMAGIVVALILAWLLRKGRMVGRLVTRTRLLLAGLAEVRGAQGDEARQTLLIRVGSDAISFGLVGLLAILVLLVVVEAAPTLLHWGAAPHAIYLASLSVVLVLQAFLGRSGRRG
jgi:hypothetical protein